MLKTSNQTRPNLLLLVVSKEYVRIVAVQETLEGCRRTLHGRADLLSLGRRTERRGSDVRNPVRDALFQQSTVFK